MREHVVSEDVRAEHFSQWGLRSMSVAVKWCDLGLRKTANRRNFEFGPGHARYQICQNLMDSFWPVDTAPTSDAGIENYGIEFWYVRLQEAPTQGSHRNEICQLDIFGPKVDAFGETFGNERGPIGSQVLLEGFECGIALCGITRSEYEGQVGSERLLAYEFVYELVADAQSQTTIDGKLVRDSAAR